ncbi:MAG: SAM-dependent methyltransferase [Chitinophagales bacterium]
MYQLPFELESKKNFSESLIWQLNRDYYQETGIAAWSDNLIPHQMTSNALVGKVYAEMILGFLKDLAAKNKTTETVYIVELGAGHGRLAFHVLKHLEKIIAEINIKLPPYCYVLTDIVEDNLTFFSHHPQFQSYLKKGVLDVAYFDASKNKEIYLRHAKSNIGVQSLTQPILAIGNYFFDSLPNDLFLFRDKTMSSFSVSLHSEKDPKDLDTVTLIKNLKPTYHKNLLQSDFYEEPILNDILKDYKKSLVNSHLFFPVVGLKCIQNLKQLSTEGLMLLSMDKGFCELADLDHRGEPQIVKHGSLSLWVNYHALGAFCQKNNGKVLFPAYSTFHSVVGCFMFLSDGESYCNTDAAYQHFINDFGPDDFNTIKKLAYTNIAQLSMIELIALMRLSYYDSTFFISILPWVKKAARSITFIERKRLAESLHQIWNMYFNLNESDDLAYEIGGLLYDIGYYDEALKYFQYSVNVYGNKADVYYNQAMCYYQLRQDQLFAETLKEAKAVFPDEALFEQLDKLDLAAI